MDANRPAKAVAVCVLLGLAACSQPPDARPYDPLARSIYRDKLFNECMAALPAGPQQTRYNDWAEVVSECTSGSWYRANERYRSQQ